MMSVTAIRQTKKEINPHLAAFDALSSERAGKEPAWVQPIRKAGISHFAELGFPTTKHEEWLFTNVAPIAQMPFKPSSGSTKVAAKDIERFTFSPSVRLVFVDGYYVPELSVLGKFGKGIAVMPIREALNVHPEILEKHLSRYARFDDNAFAALNTAFFQDGGFVHVSRGVQVEPPIHLLFVSTGNEKGRTIHPRNLIVLEQQAHARVVESYVSLGDTPYLTNPVTEIVLAESAFCEHTKLQGESFSGYHVAVIQGYQKGKSRFLSHSISTGAKIARNNIHVTLDDKACEATLNGLYLGVDEQLVDHHTAIDHAKPNCNSHEFYHGILDENSRGVFNGKIFVRQVAQKTDAKQTNRNILLSDTATMDTKPQLEIFADDVKCTHGATIGQLDETSMFYLRSRGIGEELARRMLLFAFASDVINRLQISEVSRNLDALLDGGLRKHLPQIDF